MIKSQRGAANIKKFNDERERKWLAHIKRELEKCKKNKLVFKSMGALAEYLSAITKIHRTTLMRNPRYKILLAEYAGIPEPQRSAVRDEDAPREVLRARMLALRLENTNLQDKLKRLEAYLQRKGELSVLSKSDDKLIERVVDDKKYYLDFIDTAMALTALIERLKDSIFLNFAHKSIEDRAARLSQRVVVGPERAAAYFDWLTQHKHLFLEFNEDKHPANPS